MTHEDKIIEEFTKPQIIVDKFRKKIGESQWSPYCIEQLRQALTTYRAQVLEEVEKIVDNIEIKEQGSLDYIHSQELKETLMKLKHPHQLTHSMDTTKVTRIEVIDHTKSLEDGGGRVYVNSKDTNKVELSLQDDGKTLKVFINNKN